MIAVILNNATVFMIFIQLDIDLKVHLFLLWLIFLLFKRISVLFFVLDWKNRVFLYNKDHNFHQPIKCEFSCFRKFVRVIYEELFHILLYTRFNCLINFRVLWVSLERKDFKNIREKVLNWQRRKLDFILLLSFYYGKMLMKLFLHIHLVTLNKFLELRSALFMVFVF